MGADYDANDADDDYYEGNDADGDYYEGNDADDDCGPLTWQMHSNDDGEKPTERGVQAGSRHPAVADLSKLPCDQFSILLQVAPCPICGQFSILAWAWHLVASPSSSFHLLFNSCRPDS